MAGVALDTLRISKRLREAGLSEPQADALTAIISDATDADARQFVTKQDLQIELAPIRTDIALMKWMLGANIALTVAIVVKLFVA